MAAEGDLEFAAACAAHSVNGAATGWPRKGLAPAYLINR